MALMGLPVAPNAGLDASWQLMLIHAHAAGMQFGREVIFTWGPWGFLCCSYHMGAAGAFPVLAWQIGGQVLVALAAVALTWGLARWRRIAFVVLFAAFHWLFLDTEYFVLIALIAVSGLMRRDASLAGIVGWALALGFLSQLKFTYLLLSCAGVLASAACWCGRRSWPRAAAAAFSYAGSVVAAWLAAGQNPDNLYPYVIRSLEITSGYAAAMGLDESRAVFLWGAAAALLCAIFLLSMWRAMPERAFAASACGFLAVSLLAMWKEGFTRADMIPLGGHVFGLFTYCLILSPALPGLLLPARRWHWFDFVAPLCLAAFAQFDGELYRLGPRIVWERMYWSARGLGRLGKLPGEWQEAYTQSCAKAALPLVSAAVGKATVDVYDYTTAVALMNDLNLDSRPVFQGYSAYTPSLEGWNLRFYQSAHAPDYLLWSEERVDDRYPGEDDAMLVAAVAGHYRPLFREGDYWLLRRVTPVAQGAMGRNVMYNRRVWLTERVDLPADRSHAIWIAANPVPTKLGRARALLYKPAQIDIATTDERGNVHSWRVVPRVAEAGFILAPLLERGDDAAAFMGGEYRTWIRSFQFEAPRGQERFWSYVDVTLFAIPALPMRRADDDSSDSSRRP
jgi:hypothetical protein